MYYWKNYLPKMATYTQLRFEGSFVGMCVEIYSHADFTDEYCVVFHMEKGAALHCFTLKEGAIHFAKNYGKDCQIFVIDPTTGELKVY